MERAREGEGGRHVLLPCSRREEGRCPCPAWAPMARAVLGLHVAFPREERLS